MSMQPQHRPTGPEPRLQPVETAAAESGVSPDTQDHAMWFFWLIGLSVVNTVLGFLHMDIAFIFGLGITQVLEGMGMAVFGESGLLIALIPNVFVLAYFGLMGFFALRGHAWAFAAGMLAYTGDALLLLLFGDWLSVAVHGYVLFQLGQGLMGCLKR